MEELIEFETLLYQIGYTSNGNLTQMVVRQGTYLFLINGIFNKNQAMCYRTRNTQVIKARHYAVCMVGLNKYLELLMGSNAANSICEAGIDEILLHGMTNCWGMNYFL